MKKISIILIGILSILLVSCSSNSSTTDTNVSNSNEKNNSEIVSRLDKIKKNKTIIFATSADFPPYEFHKIIDGDDKIVGFDIDLANEIANKLGVKLDIKDIDFNAALAGIQSGKYDMCIAGISKTPERANQFEFSDIYYNSSQTAIVRKDDIDKYKTREDFKDKIVGAQLGTIQEEIANTLEAKEVHSLGKITDLILELKSGKIDAIVIEKPSGESYEKNNDDLKLTDIILEEDEELGCRVISPKGDLKFAQAINEIVKEVVETKKMDKFVQDAIELSNN